MHRRIVLLLIIATSLGCGGKNLLQGQQGDADRRKRALADATSEQAPRGGVQPGSTPTNPAPPTQPAAPLAETTQLTAWCAKAAQTKPVQGKLASTFKFLCTDGKPTALLQETLVRHAYAGGDDLQLIDLEPMSSTRSTRTTSYTFAVGIKLPVDIKTYFEKVAPRVVDPAETQKLAEMIGATGESTIEKEFRKDGPFHERGWLVRSQINEEVILVTLDLDSRNRVDQFVLNEADSYLFTQYIDEVIKVALRFDVVTAGLQIGADAYLLSTISLKVDNKGFAPIAEDKLQVTANNTVKRMYELAKEAAGTK